MLTPYYRESIFSQEKFNRNFTKFTQVPFNFPAISAQTATRQWIPLPDQEYKKIKHRMVKPAEKPEGVNYAQVEQSRLISNSLSFSEHFVE
jgi:hypothetical protein